MVSDQQIRPDYDFSGARLQAARKAAKLTLWRLSLRLAQLQDPYHSATIRTWEMEISEPRAGTFFRLCYLLKKPPEYFFIPSKEPRPVPLPNKGGRRGQVDSAGMR